MEFYTETLPILRSGPGVPGHGEGLMIAGREYYYACEAPIPRDRVVSLVREGSVDGDRGWAVVAHDPERGFALLEVVGKNLMRELMKYRGVSSADAIAGRRAVRPPA